MVDARDVLRLPTPRYVSLNRVHSVAMYHGVLVAASSAQVTIQVPFPPILSLCEHWLASVGIGWPLYALVSRTFFSLEGQFNTEVLDTIRGTLS